MAIYCWTQLQKDMLPDELWWSILTYLDPITLLRVRATDAQKRSLVDHSIFAREYWGGAHVAAPTTLGLLRISCVHCGKFQGAPMFVDRGRTTCLGCISFGTHRWHPVPEEQGLTVWAGGAWRHPPPRKEPQ